MTRPDEIAALADDLRRLTYGENAITNDPVRLGLLVRVADTLAGLVAPENALADELDKRVTWLSSRSRIADAILMQRAAKALRLSATSPGDAVRDVLHEFDVHQYVSDYEFRADQDYKPNEHEQAILEDAINGVISGIEAALAPAEKAGDEFTRSFDTRGTTMRRRCNIFEITCETGDIANRVGDQLRSPSATPTPPSADVDETGWLIEKDDPPVYHQVTDDYDEHWTPDASKALRFARREDAQAYSDHIGWTSPPVRIAEHMWPIQSAAPGGGTKSDGGVEVRHAETGNKPVSQPGEETSSSATSFERATVQEAAIQPCAGVTPGPSDPAQEPEAVALKPCPFCGGEAGYEESFGSPTIRCIADHCYVRPIFRCWASKDEVIQQWNTRPVSLEREALLDRVVKFDECETAEPTLRKMILGYYMQGLQPDAELARKFADRFILALIEGMA